MKVTFYLKRPDSDTATAIYAHIFYDGYKRVKYYLPDKQIEPKHWNTKKHEARQTLAGHAVFNRELKTKADDILEVITKYKSTGGGKPPTPDTLKGLLKEKWKSTPIDEIMTFFKFFNIFIEDSKAGIRLTDKSKPIAPGTIRAYEVSKTFFEKYNNQAKTKMNFDSIDMAFYTDFKKYAIKQQQSTNYIGKHIKTLKSVLRYAENHFNVEVNQTYNKKIFTTIKEDADTIYLPEHELRDIAELDLSDSLSLDRVRDLFLIGCYTGLRYSDLSTLRPEHINGNMITIKAQKTGETVVIPVHSMVKQIMLKYGGNLPPALAPQKANEAIKKVCEKTKSLKKLVSVSGTKGGKLTATTLPKFKLVTTHTARRSFATNQHFNKVPALDIMKITGHKTESAFMKYIKMTSNDSAQTMQEIWDRKELEPVKQIAI